jgi:hypothetical protein
MAIINQVEVARDIASDKVAKECSKLGKGE